MKSAFSKPLNFKLSPLFKVVNETVNMFSEIITLNTTKAVPWIDNDIKQSSNRQKKSRREAHKVHMNSKQIRLRKNPKECKQGDWYEKKLELYSAKFNKVLGNQKDYFKLLTNVTGRFQQSDNITLMD